MEIIFLILILSQIYLFYIHFSKKKVDSDKINKDSIVLKPIPKDFGIDQVEGFEDTVRDVLVSAKNENWKCTIIKDEEYYYTNYDLTILSEGVEPIEISALVRIENSDNAIDLGRFWIKKNGSFITVEDTYLENDLLVFLWDFILEYEVNNRSNKYSIYKENFEDIRKSLKNLYIERNREKKLDELLDN